MTKYGGAANKNGVGAYSIEIDSITVRFKRGGTYLYTYSSAGINNVEEMKKLATKGKGLNTFINRYVRNRYEAKLST